VTAERGASELALVGHSMGGILLMCYLAAHPNAPVSRGISVGAALDYRLGNSRFQRLLPLRGIFGGLSLNLPYGDFRHLTAPLYGRLFSRLDDFHVWPSNIEPAMLRRMYACMFSDIPTPLLNTLAGLFDSVGL